MTRITICCVNNQSFKKRFLQYKESFVQWKESFVQCKECFVQCKESFVQYKESFVQCKECFVQCKECFVQYKECFVWPLWATIHMATLLVKAFPQVKAISKDETQVPLLSKDPIQTVAVQRIVGENMSLLSGSYAQNMPNWVVAKYFDPNFERQRLMVHDYQQTELRKMRCMDGCKLVDSIELPLKSSADILSAFNHMLPNGLSIYLDQFLAPFVGDWPTQFYMRQIVYCNDGSVPTLCKNIAPVIGPLHISLNSRECVVLHFHAVFSDLSLERRQHWQRSLNPGGCPSS